jgi:hypothetical protein
MAVLNIRRYQETDFEAAWHLHVLWRYNEQAYSLADPGMMMYA